jgi:16S rRNA (uracil1498-N3)-methyltransferase
MDYFYTPPENISGTSIRIDGEEYSHLTHVMRKKAGDTIRVVDGLGTAYDVLLEETLKGIATGTILKTLLHHNEPGINLTIAVGILKNPSKFDFLVEKVTELGVKEVIPLLTERTIPSHAKIDRWQKLALAGMKQSGRSYLPVVRELTSLEQFLQNDRAFDASFIAHEKLTDGPRRVDMSFRSAVILIGPEGGFSDNEIDHCRKAGFTPLYFGERRLRTETAAIVASTLILVTY